MIVNYKSLPIYIYEYESDIYIYTHTLHLCCNHLFYTTEQTVQTLVLKKGLCMLHRQTQSHWEFRSFPFHRDRFLLLYSTNILFPHKQQLAHFCCIWGKNLISVFQEKFELKMCPCEKWLIWLWIFMTAGSESRFRNVHVKSQHLIPRAKKITVILQMLDLRGNTDELSHHLHRNQGSAILKYCVWLMHRQRQLHSSVTVGYSWMYLLLLIYRELMSLLCTLSQPKKKPCFKLFCGTKWCSTSTRVINVCMIIEY